MERLHTPMKCYFPPEGGLFTTLMAAYFLAGLDLLSPVKKDLK